MREDETPRETIDQDVEPIRLAMMSILADRELLLRKAHRAAKRAGVDLQRALAEIVGVAEHIDDMVRILYWKLPAYMRPEEPLREIKPEGRGTSTRPQPSGRIPAARIPREERWPALTERMVLEMADAHFEQHGKWPSPHDGRVKEGRADTWCAINQALGLGLRGLPGGTSLTRLITANRNVSKVRRPGKRTVEQISAWVDAYHRRTGEWPKINSGPIPEAPGETWAKINSSLLRASAGLPEPLSLPKYLHNTRGIPIYHVRSPLTEEQILQWADVHHARTGSWPTRNSGAVVDAPGELWSQVDSALHAGQWLLPKDGSLARLLAARRGRRHKDLLPPISLEDINGWVLNHYLHNGRLPRVKDGEIEEAPGETWSTLDEAFRVGRRGLAGCGCRSLKEFLDRRFPRPEFGQHAYRRSILKYNEILEWADAHHALTGTWPNDKSGEIPEAPGETWSLVCHSMRSGIRGLPRKLSLASLLEEKRGVTHPFHKDVTLDWILELADAHFARTGSWPNGKDRSPIPEAPEDSWFRIDNALINGLRGLPKSGSLAQFLLAQRGRRHRRNPPPLNLDDLELWARNYVARHGRWPSHFYGGRVEEAPEEAWRAIYCAFKEGKRGLLFSGYTSLKDFLMKRLGPPPANP